MKYLKLSKEDAIVWLKMISRACTLIIISAAALQMNEWGIAVVTIIGQLAVERLSLFSNETPSPDQAAYIKSLEANNAQLTGIVKQWVPAYKEGILRIPVPDPKSGATQE